MNAIWFVAGVLVTIAIEFIILFIAAIAAVSRANKYGD